MLLRIGNRSIHLQIGSVIFTAAFSSFCVNQIKFTVIPFKV